MSGLFTNIVINDSNSNPNIPINFIIDSVGSSINGNFNPIYNKQILQYISNYANNGFGFKLTGNNYRINGIVGGKNSKIYS